MDEGSRGDRAQFPIEAQKPKRLSQGGISMRHFLNRNVLVLAAGLALLSGATAKAEDITWVNWTSASAGSPGTATGTIALGSGVAVTYNGQVGGLEYDTDWGSSGTYAGGNVSDGPPNSSVDLWMTGGGSYAETITFSQAVTDPTMAFWSLGSGSTTAEFDFTNDEPFTIQACGPSDDLGGSCITQSGNNVYGNESNGTIQFLGTFTELTFTTPADEYWYDFTVGAAALADVTPPPVNPPTATPEPSSLALMSTGLMGFAGVVRRRLRRA
jgi:hypothetical protein